MIRALLISILSLAMVACVTTPVGDNPVAEANDQEAAKLNLDMGVKYYSQGNMQASREKLEKALEQDPDLADARRMLGIVYQAMGDMKEAEAEYKKAVNLSPRDPDTLNDYAGFLCFEKRDVDKALEYFDKGLRIPLNENRVMLYRNAARCARGLYPKRAEAYLRTALSAEPENAQLMIEIADLAYSEEQYLQARIFLERAMQMSEPTPTALFLLSRVESQLGNVGKANEYRQQLLDSFPLSQEALAIQTSTLN